MTPLLLLWKRNLFHSQLIVLLLLVCCNFTCIYPPKFSVVHSGENLQFVAQPVEGQSPRKAKKSDKKSEKKNAKVEPMVSILFNDIKINSNVMKRNANPEWNQVFEMYVQLITTVFSHDNSSSPLEPDWQIKESIVSFKVKDRASKGVMYVFYYYVTGSNCL